VTQLRLGIAGTGIAALQVLPHLAQLSDRIALTALADARRENMAFFCERYGRPVAMCDSVEELCARPDVDALWVRRRMRCMPSTRSSPRATAST